MMGLTPEIVGTDSALTTKLRSLVINSDRFKLSGAGTFSPEESEVSLHLFPTHSFLNFLKGYLKDSQPGILRAGKHCPQSPEKREKGRRRESRLASSPVHHKLTDVQREVLEPKAGILFYQEPLSRGSVSWSG